MNRNHDEKKIVRITALILALLWMIVIFYFSAQPSEESSDTSMTASYGLVLAADKLFGLNLRFSQMLHMASGIEKTVRKIAHMTEYAILSLLWNIALNTKNDMLRVLDRFAERSQRRLKTVFINKWWLIFSICFIYAASDEIHQLFVAGRHSALTDVLIDSCGALIVLIIVFLSAYKKYKKAADKIHYWDQL